MRPSTASTVSQILIVMLSAACGAGAQSDGPVAQRDDPIVGLWEGRKVDGRYQTTEPWGPLRSSARPTARSPRPFSAAGSATATSRCTTSSSTATASI